MSALAPFATKNGTLPKRQECPARAFACAHGKKSASLRGRTTSRYGEMMRRREFIAFMGASVAWPFAALAQQAGRTYRLGCLRLTPRDAAINVAFFDELSLKGKTSRSNIAHMRPARRSDSAICSRASQGAGRCHRNYWGGNGSRRSAGDAIVGDMLGSGLVTSLARPDGNTTGVSILARELDGKRQDILIEAVPGLHRMAVLTDVNYTKFAKLDALQEAARARNIEFSVHRVTKGEEIAAAIDSAQASGAKALNILASPLLYAHRHLIMERTAAAHLPTIYDFPESAEEGGFAAYGPRLGQLYTEIMPQQIVKLFRGSKVADIAVEQATKFEPVINLKTARALGVTVPPALLVRADKVIE